jgi:hypothetical protein
MYTCRELTHSPAATIGGAPHTWIARRRLPAVDPRDHGGGNGAVRLVVDVPASTGEWQKLEAARNGRSWVSMKSAAQDGRPLDLRNQG